MDSKKKCSQCGACCIALSISSALPGMEKGKPAGIPCVNLTEDHLCAEYSRRPAVCREFSPTELCGSSFEEAMCRLGELERLTAPEQGSR